MGDSDITLILEDDVDFVEGFLPMWRARLASIEDDPTWSWVYLGYSTDQDLYSDVPKIQGSFNFPSRFRTYGGGTFAYAIAKGRARASPNS